MLTSLAYRRHIPPQMLQPYPGHLYRIVPVQPAVRRHVAHPRRVRDMDSVMLIDPFGQGTEISAGIQVIDMAAVKNAYPSEIKAMPSSVTATPTHSPRSSMMTVCSVSVL